MKRLFAIGLMLASAFALTSCMEELADQRTPDKDETAIPEIDGVPFKIYASLDSAVDTKTVTEKNEATLKTVWEEGDQILGFYEKDGILAEDPITFTVDPANPSAGEFTGTVPPEILKDDGSKYNWYFVYGATDHTASSGVAVVEISNSQSQDPTNDVAHIGDFNCPMYGKVLNLSGPIFPRVQMTHLATLHEVTVRNDTKENATSGATAGNIYVYDFGMSIATQGVWDTSNRISLAGKFQLNLKDGTIKNYANNVDNITLSLPADGVKITPDNTSKFYLVTAPIDNLQINATYDSYYLTTDPTSTITVDAYKALPDTEKQKYTGNILRKDELKFIINGSVRPTLTEKTYEGFDGGALKRFILPITEMQSPLVSDAINIQTSGRNGNNDSAVTTPKYLVSIGKGNDITTPVTVNGHSGVPAYILDESAVENNSNKIIIRGFLKDMVKAIPIGFYASQWNNTPTAMTIDMINVWLPEYPRKYIVLGEHQYHKYSKRDQIANYSLMDLVPSSLLEKMGLELSDGLQREELVNFIDATNITFNGMPSNGYQDEKKGNNFVVMYEDATYKDINVGLINFFLKNKFSATHDGTYYEASYEGLYAILDASINYNNGNLTYKAFGNYSAVEMEEFAINTANGMYYKMQAVLESRVEAGGTLLTLLVSDPTHFMHILRDMEIELVIKTHPYSGNKYAPIVFWGLDAYGPNKSTANN